jgi:hypothetical protein
MLRLAGAVFSRIAHKSFMSIMMRKKWRLEAAV